MDLYAAGVVCPKKYDETESCGSAAHFLSDVTINGACNGIDDKEGMEGDAGVTCKISMLDNNGNTSQCVSIPFPHGLPPADVALPSQQTYSLPPDAVASTKLPAMPVCKPTRARPRTSNKFGRGKGRGGDRKFTLHRAIDIMPPPPEAADVYMAGGLPTTNSKSKKKLSFRSLKTSERKHLNANARITVANKKLHVATNQCKTLRRWHKTDGGKATWPFIRPNAFLMACGTR
jgi:hypothetical protein